MIYQDPLTGLHNRRFYEDEIGRLKTIQDEPIALIMADVNGLKETNDSLGHYEGDKILEKVGYIFKKACRAEEKIARIGGDEFVILMPRTSYVGAEELKKRIRRLIANENKKGVVVSISMGSAVKRDKSMNMEDVFKVAEEDMYRNKALDKKQSCP
ncbi:MAG TPA: GGDEF domain-containing protein [Clostridia bacterium]|nr:GGDEF domain-containing protein [Clostridia bacterium]